MSRRNSRATKAHRRAQRRQRQQRQETGQQGPRPAGRQDHVLDVELSRLYFPEDELGEEYVTWSAEWGLRGDSVGTEDSNEDLQQLINDLIQDTRQWADRYNITLEWELGGDTPPGKTMQDMVTEAGVTLPATVIPLAASPAGHLSANKGTKPAPPW